MTQAAEQLMVAQPFLSRTIAELEDAQRELADLVSDSEREVRLVTNTSLYMAGLLSKYRILAPDVNFHQSSARRFKMIRQLKAGKVDFAICTPSITEDEELESITLIEDECPIIHPPGHWLQEHSCITLEQLKNGPFISAAPGYGIRDLAEIFFEEAGVRPPIIMESTDTSVVPQYVKQGLASGFPPVSSVLRDHYTTVSAPPCIGVVGLTWKRDRYLSKVAEGFRDIAAAYFRELQRVPD